MNCYCRSRVVSPKKRACKDCLVANDIIIGCGQELYPCGGTTTVDLNSHNDNPSDAVYSIRKYNTDDFSSVTTTAAGIATLVAGTAYTPHGLHEFEYKVVRGDYTNFGTVKVCFDSPCEDGCDKCNTCSGLCYGTPEAVEVTATCGQAGLTYNAAAALNMAACDGTTTWTVEGPDAISVEISNTGVITYSMTDLATPGVEYVINWNAACSLYGMEAEGVIIVTIENQCVGVTCAANEECNKCTGECEELESDMSGTGGGIGSTGPIVSTS